MSFWIAFWGGLLVVSLAGFALLALVVGIGGYRDVRSLFRSIERRHDEKPTDSG